MIEIKDLHAAVDDKPILNGVNLTIQKGQIHVIMGPNGAGKSTLGKVLAGDPGYEVTSGEVLFNGQNILELDPEERAHVGLFLGFQYPVEIAGISNQEFLFHAYNAKRKAHNKAPLTLQEFATLLEEKMALMEIKREFIDRSVNEGFSGGEKKRNEILQMEVLDPSFAILDETDSGLDIDAMCVVANGINRFFSKDKAILLITHYQRLLNYIQPDFVHVMREGRIVQTGTAELSLELEKKGYR
jgi:Fe-S cluster assembly ATP-binding protein